MFRNIEWLFFDVGSTLINEEKVYKHIFHDIADATGESYEKIYDMAIRFYKENKKGDLELAKMYGIPALNRYLEEEELYSDAMECLEILRQKYKIGVIANQSFGTASRLEQHGILKYVDLVVASAEEGVSKPNPKIFQIALERSGCKPENAVMIGDRIDNDIVPAKRIGMHTVWMKQGFGGLWRINEEEMPEKEVYHLSELKRLFLC